MGETSSENTLKIMSEKEQIELVFLKFGLARSDEQLEAIVDKYLPIVLEKVTSKDEGIHSKVMELLNHISNRLKSRVTVRLPVSKLLRLYISDSSGFVVNFTIIYIKLGFRRLTLAEKKNLAPVLFASIEGKPKAHQDALMHLIISTFPLVKLVESSEGRENLFQFDKFTSATKRLLEFCLDVLLLQYSVNFKSQNLTSSRPAPAGEMTSGSLQPGLSVDAIKRITDPSDFSWSAQQIEELKIGILNMIGGDFFPENDIICHLVVASSDTRHTVSTVADLELRKRQNAVDWNNVGLISQLYRLYLGDAQVQQTSKKMKKASPGSIRQPVNLRTKLKIVQALLRSRSATERFPSTIQLVYDALFAEGSMSKLQIMGLELVHHISDSCSLTKLAAQSPLLLEAMLKIIRNDEKEPRTRGLAYTAIGKLSNRVPNLFSAKLQLLQDCFQALSQENSQELKLYIQEALAMMTKAYSMHVAESHLTIMEAVVTQYISDQNHLCRLSAVRYAGTVFPTDHVASRYLLLLAKSDAKEDVAAEASRVLDGTTTYDYDMKEVKKEDPNSTKKHVTFRKMLEYSYEKAQKLLKSSHCHVIGTQTISFAPATFLALIQYLRRCLLCDAGIKYSANSGSPADAVMEAPKLAEYLGEQWNHEKEITTELVSKYVELIMQFVRAVADSNAAYILLEMFAICPDDFSIKCLLAGSLNSEDRTKQAEYDSLVFSRLEWIRSLSHHVKETIREYFSELYTITMKRLSLSVPMKNEIMNDLLRDAKSDKNYEKKHGAILTLGFLLGDFLSVTQGFKINDVNDVIYTLVKNALSKDATIATASCTALAEIMRKSKLSIPDGNIPSNNGKDYKNVEDISSDDLTKSDVVGILIYHMKSSTIHKLREKSIIALGCLPVGEPDYAHRELLLNALMESFDIKETDIQFTVATALCNAALGHASATHRNRWRKLSSATTVQDTMQRQDKVSWLLEKILKEYVYHRIPVARQASCIWLMTIVKTEELSSHPDVLEQLPHIQAAFMSLLAEDDDLVQDVASKGLGVVYELGSDEQKKELVNSLVSSLMGGQNPQAAKSNKADLFKSMGSLGKAPDGSKLSTYKELCSLASDLNQPDLVYKFLHLAKHHALWNSKKGAAFGFSNIASLASVHLEPHLPQVVPRLFRYTFDPQSGVRSAMTSIWNALAPDPYKLIDTYICEVTNDLKKNLLQPTWRTRQASCYALSDLLRSGRGMQGKDKEILINALPELWSSTLKVMDDIKETVRDAATVAAKSLKKVTLKLCDKDQGKIGEMAVTNIIPVLLKDGLSSSVTDVSVIRKTMRRQYKE